MRTVKVGPDRTEKQGQGFGYVSNYRPAQEPMSGSAFQEFTDPHEYQASILTADVRVLVTRGGAFRSSLTRVNLPRLRLQRGSASLPVVEHTFLHSARRPIFFLANSQQEPIRNNGIQLSPGEIVFSSPGAEKHLSMSAESTWAAMSLTAEDLATAGRTVFGRDLVAPDVTRIVRPHPQLMVRLQTLHEAIARLAIDAPEIFAHSGAVAAMEHELVGLMVRCLTEGTEEGPSRPGHQRLSVMQRFEQILDSSQERPLHMAELCAAIGVSERTLRLHCVEHLGVSPHRYLWLRRMHLVRRELSLAAPTESTVTKIATDHGFWELGRFAVAYRRLFGESPSTTLKCGRDCRPSGYRRRELRLLR